MSLGVSLSLVLAAFVALMATVLGLALAERRSGGRIEASDVAAQKASDARVLVAIFGSIIGGMVLTVVTGVLVFL